LNLLLVSYHHADTNSVGSLRSRALMKYLPKFGMDVSVLACAQGSAPITVRDRTIEISSSSPDQYDPNAWLKQCLRFCEEIRQGSKPDLIIATYPPIEALEAGLALSTSYDVPMVSDFRDGLLFDSLEAAANALHRERYAGIEAKVAENSIMIVTVSPPISAYFQSRYAHPRVHTMYNGFDHDDIEPDRRVVVPCGRITICHTGRLDYSRWGTSQNGNGLQALSAALLSLTGARPEIAKRLLFHFAGHLSPEEVAILSPWVARGSVKLWGVVDRPVALGLQHRADVLLLITAPNVPSIATGKLFEYLKAAKPILALTRGTEAARIVGTTRAGVNVPPDDPDAIMRALVRMVEDDDFFPRRDEEAVATYSRSHQISAFAEAIRQLRFD